MDYYCDHVRFPDSDDENLLLDDNNTTNPKCIKCRASLNADSRDSKNWPKINIQCNDLLDSPEDSPLLFDERINSFGHLSVKDFHCHSLSAENDNKVAYKTLCIVSALCLFFMVMEIIGGYLAGSLAVMTDAAHLFSDLIGFFVSIISIWIGKRPPTKSMTFGYNRVEVIGAFLSVLIVWVLAAVFSLLALERIIHRDHKVDADTMLIIAGLGLVVNIVMGAVLHGFCFKVHSHSHGDSLIESNHSHGEENLNIRAAAAHVIGDLLQSVGVLIAAIVIKIFPDAVIADPICTILFSVIVVGATVKVAKDSLMLLAEASPRGSWDLSNALSNIPGVRHVHSLHIWSLAPGKDAVAAHLAVDDASDRDTVLNRATEVVKDKLKVVSCTIQIEAYNHQTMSECIECQQLQV
ncbi:PREDICTED: zinc transporter 2-like [Nicrophorus vespilloides]|uniref:Zinc transporter 2-like n=1 Tax=Nicrophorus vespilloides TaxID=110193 RepID=A0ABM1MGK2_NICVS|nr:PREDICTED: zinc transporter 2-like [Nicrophorus vespilloides]XP_017773703.1 PREDICTED: zinc transporter 2-like [Nicrophorus vespilloides]